MQDWNIVHEFSGCRNGIHCTPCVI